MYKRQLKLNPNHGLATYNMGVTYSDKKEYSQAVTWFTRYIALAPDDPDGYESRGNAYRHQSQYDEAIADYNPVSYTHLDVYKRQVSGYTINAATGALTAMAGSPFLSGSGAFTLAFAPSGEFGYVTAFGSLITAFSINPTSRCV